MADLNELQEQCAKFVSDIDAKYNIKRDPQFSFTQLMEEIGELAKEINKPRLRNKEIDQTNLEGEFADIFLQLMILAKMHNVNMEKSVNAKMETIKERHHIN